MFTFSVETFNVYHLEKVVFFFLLTRLLKDFSIIQIRYAFPIF